MPFVTAYSKTTGRKQVVPAHWLDHKVLGRNIRKTPLAESRQRSTTTTETPAAGDNEKE